MFIAQPRLLEVIRSFFHCRLEEPEIRVNVVSPGPTETPMTRSSISDFGVSGEQIKKSLVVAIPLGRMGSPDEVANVVLFLASDDSSFVTGIELFVDGGMAQI